MLTIATLVLVGVLIWFAGMLARGAYKQSETNLELTIWIVAAIYTLSSAALVARLGVEAGILG